MRYTPEYIKELLPHEIFVFGSNMAGRHGAGAAKQAMTWGALYGVPSGIMGQTYGIPTKDYEIKRSLTLMEINYFVAQFLKYTSEHQENTFLVTKIGCGLAGYSPNQIGPLFLNHKLTGNILLPKEFYC
jgi:hypothetical protein